MMKYCGLPLTPVVPKPFSLWPLWSPNRSPSGPCGPQTVLPLTPVVPKPFSLWPLWSPNRSPSGPCGPQTVLLLAPVVPKPFSFWPLWSPNRSPSGPCGPQTVLPLAPVVPKPFSFWPLWSPNRSPSGPCGPQTVLPLAPVVPKPFSLWPLWSPNRSPSGPCGPQTVLPLAPVVPKPFSLVHRNRSFSSVEDKSMLGDTESPGAGGGHGGVNTLGNVWELEEKTIPNVWNVHREEEREDERGGEAERGERGRERGERQREGREAERGERGRQSHDSVKLIKFADDTTLIGLISNNDESAYRREVDRLVSWCSGNNLELNAQKTVEMIVDFRKSTVPPPPPSVMDSPITSVESFRFLGTTITQDLKWEPTISSLIKKAQQRMYFLRQLRKAKLPAQMLVQFYTAIIESILTSSITVWFAGATVRDKQRLQRIVRSAEEVIGRSLPSLQDLQEAAVHQD
uniref:Alkylated DNA repair protein AlkB homologue 8 N-terminal domain-containing protein n=1 Tax=Knipowitschia caucasica TaxID=637954 RepID=A0AAV2J3M0_KNICA